MLKTISDIQEFNDISELLQDEQVDQALQFVVELLADPTSVAQRGPLGVVILEGLAAKFAIQARYYTTVDKSQPQRKNVYYTMAEQMHSLAAAMKYVVK